MDRMQKILDNYQEGTYDRTNKNGEQLFYIDLLDLVEDFRRDIEYLKNELEELGVEFDG